MNIQRKAIWKIYEVLASTQVICKQVLSSSTDAQADIIVVAHSQTNGLTRQANTEWVHHKGNVAMTMGLRVDCTPENRKHLPLLQISASLSVLRSISAQETTAFIKWPNDIYKDGKKLGGILSELILDSEGKVSFLCGIGINISDQNGKDEGKGNFSFLAANVQRDNLTQSIYKELRREADLFEGPALDYFQTLEREYNRSLLWRNERVEVYDRENKEKLCLEGTLVGLNRYGGVDIQEKTGRVKSVRELVSMRAACLS